MPSVVVQNAVEVRSLTRSKKRAADSWPGAAFAA
jgi:hypothetical protein